MAYGVTDAGFVTKRLPEIKTDIETALREALGEVNLTPDSVFGQLVGVFAKPAADVWEVLEDVYYAHYPNTAEGVALDSVVALNAITRRPASHTTVDAIVTGTEALVLTAGAQASTTNEAIIFVLAEDVTITKANVLRAALEVTTLTTGHEYRIIVNSTACNYTATALDTKASVAANLVGQVLLSGEPVTATDDGVDTVTITADDLTTPFTIDNLTKLTLIERWTPCRFDAQNTGPLLAVTGTLTVIETPVSGWAGVDNLVAGSTGLPLETDAELRTRRLESLRIIGAGTVESIRARLLNNVADVTAVAIFENREDITVDSRPPHSFEAVVSGGTDQDIADMLWATKPAGIQTYGTENVDVTDSNGDLQTVYFSRPISVPVWVDVVVTEYTEETLPTDWVAQIKQAIYDYGAALALGKDLIIQRWYVPIYSVPGIASATVRHAIAAPPPWSTSNIPIGSTSVAAMDLTRITVA